MQRLDAVSTAVVTSEPAAASSEPPMERLLVNAIIHQPSGAAPASWLRIEGNTIAAVGTGEPPAVPDSTQVVDLQGKYVMPGLHDAHIHTYSVGEAMYYVDLGGCASIAELKDRVAAHAAKEKDASWIIGFNWAQHEMGGVCENTSNPHYYIGVSGDVV